MTIRFASLQLYTVLLASIVGGECHLLTAQSQAQSPVPIPARNSASDQALDQEASNFVLQSTVRRVIVDVVVTDSQQHQVRDLAQEDFSVTEDGKTQQVLSFEEHDMDSDIEVTPSSLPPLPVNTFNNLPRSLERGPLNVILYDMLDTSTDDQPVARQQILKFIDQMPQGSRFAIFVLSDGLHLIQGFTAERGELHVALDPQTRPARLPKIFLYADSYKEIISPLGSLLDIARFLASLPGRKNLIWLSDHFPIPALEDPNNPLADIPLTNDQIRQVTNVLAGGQIAIYPIDVRGVAIGGVAGTNEGLNAEYLGEDALAEATGGHAFHSTNDLGGAIAEAAETGARYYTLSYSPSNHKWDGGLRHIHIALAKPGCHLDYRRSYFGDDIDSPKQREQLPPADALFANMQHGAPAARGLFFQAQVHVGSPSKQTKSEEPSVPEEQSTRLKLVPRRSQTGTSTHTPVQPFAIEYRVYIPQPPVSFGDPPPPNLEFAVAVFDAMGHILNAVIQKTEDTVLAAGQKGNASNVYRVQQQFDVPSHAAWIRVAARDLASDRIGTLEVALPLAAELPTRNAAQ